MSRAHNDPGPVFGLSVQFGAHYVAQAGEERPDVTMHYATDDGTWRGARFTQLVRTREEAAALLQTVRLRTARHLEPGQ